LQRSEAVAAVGIRTPSLRRFVVVVVIVIVKFELVGIVLLDGVVERWVD
jgi:hypothetical protein